MSAIDLSGKRAVITGASQGIGQAAAIAFARAGANVAGFYRPNAPGRRGGRCGPHRRGGARRGARGDPPARRRRRSRCARGDRAGRRHRLGRDRRVGQQRGRRHGEAVPRDDGRRVAPPHGREPPRLLLRLPGGGQSHGRRGQGADRERELGGAHPADREPGCLLHGQGRRQGAHDRPRRGACPARDRGQRGGARRDRDSAQRSDVHAGGTRHLRGSGSRSAASPLRTRWLRRSSSWPRTRRATSTAPSSSSTAASSSTARSGMRGPRRPTEWSTAPSGRAGWPDAASSVAHVSSGYARFPRPCLGLSHRTQPSGSPFC